MTIDDIIKLRRTFGLTRNAFAYIIGVTPERWVEIEEGCIPIPDKVDYACRVYMANPKRFADDIYRLIKKSYRYENIRRELSRTLINNTELILTVRLADYHNMTYGTYVAKHGTFNVPKKQR